MTLVITLFAAVIATALWYAKAPANQMRIGVLALIYWGASLMWTVDGISCLIEGEAFIDVVDKAAMFDDAMLGVVVVLTGLVAWSIYLLVRDPKGVLRKAITK